MSPIEFTELIEASGVINDFFTFKEIVPLWNLSMMTQKDEITSDKHLNMNFTEFIEAICRVADKLSIPHLLDDEINEDDVYGDISIVREWGQRSLGYKLESFLLLLAQNCLSRKQFQKEVIPSLNEYKGIENLHANDIEVSGYYNKASPDLKETLERL